MINGEDSHRGEAIRQFMHNDCSGLVFAYDKEIIDRRIAVLESENKRLKEKLQGDTNE